MQFIEMTVLILMCSMLAIVGGQECGKRKFNPTLVTGGQDAARGEFPWVVGLYRLKEGKYEYTCGGTLIRTSIVITGAICVFNLSDNKSILNASDYKVALGKLYRNYNGDPTNSGVQVVDVESIAVPQRFRGVARNLESDIAVLRLASHVKLTRAVNVACVELDGCSDESVFSSGVKGTVAGWGMNNNHTEGPETMQWLDLPWIGDVKCFEETHPRNRLYLTLDKFCAGYANQEKSVCAGDSGNGYVVLKNGRYYLRGVASIALSFRSGRGLCVDDFYTAFTSVAFHRGWVKREIGEEDTVA